VAVIALRDAVSEGIPVDAEGTWRFVGYGSLFEVGHWKDDINVYNQAGSLCWRDPSASGGEANNLIAYVAHSRRNSDTAFANTPDGTQFHVEPVRYLPPRCLRAERG
jgi:hypothetical protein